MTKEEQLKFHELQALWWMHSATNGHAARDTRDVTRGDGTRHTPEELRDDAMKTSQRHIWLYVEVAENWGEPR
jgi:hypothetical protein